MKKLICLVVFVLLLTGCTEELGAIDITPSNNGESLDISENQVIDIKLDSNATTGYQWNLVGAPDERVVKLVSSKYNAPVGGATGAGGIELWQFQSVGRGTTTLKLAYYRPSAPQNVAKEFTLTLHVQ